MTARTLTLAEAAEFLKTTPETVSAMIRGEGLPAAKVGRAWVLVDEHIVDWLSTRYGVKRCASIGNSRARHGGATSGTKVGALDAALIN